ncbi:hypothetical protein [Sinorhizobium fredii]|uniref:hypothetical protein n=1 Tax=Rhizobium fredii TaxID=380 RepID=UPI0005B352CB|nr:hypothetical protein [Sinorhizobium fredii]
MQRKQLLLTLLTLGTVGGGNWAQAQECQCTGNALGTPYVGGDSQPLKWLYAPYTVRPGTGATPTLICYHKQVENKGATEVRNVRWEVANFFRRIISKDRTSAACPYIEGDLASTPTNGSLQFGSSSGGYDTTVVQPKAGWGESASVLSPAGGDPNTNAIRTELAFDIETKDGTVVPAKLKIASSANVEGGAATLTYSVENDSDAVFYVLVNLSAQKEMLEKVPMLQTYLQLQAKEKKDFTVQVQGTPTIEPAAIVVRDEHENITALDSSGFFTVKEIKERTDASFWEMIK